MKLLKYAFYVMMVLIIFSCKKESLKNTYQPNDKLGRDAVISEGYPERNFSKIDRLHMLALSLNDSIDNDSRFLLKIGFASIPKNSVVDSAFIHLTALKPGHFGEKNSFKVERITSVWISDDVSWETQPKTDANSGVIVNAPENKLENYKIDVTNFVSNIKEGKYHNFGFMFKLESEEKPHKGIRFYSSNTKEAEKRPKLEVYYH